ncbi:flagellar basal body rod protein [Pseudalkalibacillus berkeleyi]|uniref:Flagellar basal body rod protein n=1 Tax=Pseudalkalibacillus berkeleyi TaxID=1069813 RepID=A0ABS9H552_9BACL|nr:flagellar basal body rod protein [Pseudalkalibacillus berkeleyi]MCF6139231.1 flagellar basal body rod protein [Pseudalkalibacillus berkeleyi]
MKKIGLFILGAVAAIIAFANLGPMIGLAISLVVLYYSVKQFTKTDQTSKKVLWAVVGFIALCVAASNVPAILGLAALYILYIVYKEWKKEDNVQSPPPEDEDPFTNFEREWAELNRN